MFQRVLFLVTTTLLSLSLLPPAHATQPVFTTAVDPDAGLTVIQIIQRRGYAVEEHQVTTDDRYVLTMYRLPKSYDETQKNVTAAANKPAVYLIHGLLDSSFTWVLNYRNQSLAYLLADAGYDVWLGNNRGSTWSRKHLDYVSTDRRFWDFTWEEMGKFDLPAMINYVLSTTKQSALSYIGHSEGTTQAFVGFSLNQEVAKKVSYFAALAPVAYVGDTTSIVFIALAKTYLDKWFDTFGFSEFAARNALLQDFIAKYGCAYVGVACESFIQQLVGPSQNMNSSRIHVYVSQTPAGTSVKNMGHYAQSIRDHTFRRYDYGCLCSRLLPLSLCPSTICKNKDVYGAFDPPAYNLSLIKYPRTGFYFGVNDSLATPSDIAKVRTQLPQGTIVYEKNIPEFNHLDFTWAYNAPEKLYNDLLVELAKYKGKGY
ncbi:hypothetical protein Poli38472_001444 [Pythium oligandrum]|uniref:Lipase n=1 Tax=Pythium oligandrum TaxID=41045 RepID=A0A8K1CUN9_PYTOL|nr:hypothetical protein Poli38472_001444 [Pythium oligandrum]|eukprot:TMW69288.1 hypothetical protein Poli38472_001444 [Pythium oligandrum]